MRYRPAFYLTSTTDINGNQIVNYEYHVKNKPKPIWYIGNILPGHDQYVTNTIKSINIAGKGKITFKTPEKYNFSVVNIFGDSIKKVTIEHHKIVEKNYKDSQEFTHHLTFLENGSTIYGSDIFGYPKLSSECLRHIDFEFGFTDTDSLNSTIGTLSEIRYPRGGISKFIFEPNTYEIEFTGQDTISYLSEPYNVHENTVYPKPGNQNIVDPPTFIVPGTIPRTYYITITNPPIPVTPGVSDPDGNPVTHILSTVKMKNCVVGESNGAYMLDDLQLSESQANQNFCYGYKVTLLPGLNSLSIHPPNPDVSMVVKEMIPNTNIKKWFYGGGNRIKKITYYDGILEDDAGTLLPVKETNYRYNFFDDNSSSSGTLAYPSHHFNGLSENVSAEIVGYKNVTVSETGNGRTEYTFISPADFEGYELAGGITNYFDYNRGLELKKTIYNQENDKLVETSSNYEYEEDTVQFTEGLATPMTLQISGYVKKATTNTKEFFKLGNQQKFIESSQSIELNTRRQPTLKTIIAGTDQFETKYSYFMNNALSGCIRRYDLDKVEEWKNGSKLSTQKTVFGMSLANNYQMPLFMQSAKGGEDAESRVEFVSYNHYRNPIEVRQVGGVSTVYLWGYNYNIPFMVIENATNSQLPQNLVTIARSATDANNEANTAIAINNLRAHIKNNLPNARVTSFSYKPLIGITSITDPQEYTTRYEYDGFGRLIAVKDNDGNLVSENKYYFKP